MAAAIRLHRRRGRLESNEALLEGPHLIAAALAAGVGLTRVFVTPDDLTGRRLVEGAGREVRVVEPKTLERLGTTDTPQSPIAVVSIPHNPPAPGGRVIVAWGVSDPGNCGTLIRVAAAFGYGYLAGPESADSWSPKVLRSAAGAHFSVATGVVDTIDAVRDGGRSIVATVVQGGAAPGPLPASVAVLVGSEAHGLPETVVVAADQRVTIPTTSAVESLNAAMAGAIVAFLGTVGDR